MKLSLVLFTFFSLVIAANESCAQLAADSSFYDETMWTMKKRKMVMDYMDLTEAEKASFWPVYESYHMAIQFMESETLSIISICNDPAHKMEEGELERYSRKVLQNDLLLDRVRIQYYKKFSRALTPTRASQFMQLDDNLRMMLRMEVQNVAHTSDEAHASIRQ
jgi:hypothetical protein